MSTVSVRNVATPVCGQLGFFLSALGVQRSENLPFCTVMKFLMLNGTSFILME